MEQKPTLEGSAGKCWTMNLDTLPPLLKPTLGAWILELPKQSPAWSYYFLSVISLADFPDIKPAVKKYPEAQYEILFFALNPNYEPDPLNHASIVALRPFNYVNQFNGCSDADAAEVGSRLVQQLVEGQQLAEPQGILGAQERWAKHIQLFIDVVRSQSTPE